MHRWKFSALAAAAFVSAALTTTDAAALALGPLHVRSALGQNLNAEITLPQATPAELNGLSAQIASAEAFRVQGMDYSDAARSIRVELHRNPDGTASLRLISNTPMQDPFVDLVVEAQWRTGHVARSYTLLLDPPAAQRTPATPTAMAQVAPAAPAKSAAPASVAGNNYSSSAAPRTRPVPPPTPAPAAPAPTPAPAAAPPTAPAPRPSNDIKPVATAPESTTQVRTGDTAGRIAQAGRHAGVSLDQMLVAMLRSNPDAFINGNVHRIRAGAVVSMPSREEALETSSRDARQIVAAQSRDFNAYRRSLAAKAPKATVQAADRSSSGQVQAHVAETRPAAETPDKLTLSKGSVQNAANEAQLAAQKQANDQESRLNELQRNLAELNELSKTNETNTTAATTTAQAESAAPADAASAPAPAATSTTPDIASATVATAAEASAPEAAAATDPAPQPEASKPAPAPAAAPVAEPSMVDDLLDNPLLPAGGGLLVLLLGLLGYTSWKRRQAAKAAQDPSFGDSQLHTDSFFGGSGGQQVDTSSADTAVSTMAYSPSQLDGGGDVDPVAEADVYLAYGRDVQAEDILREALRTQPERLSIHVKLAEICVKRHDLPGLEQVARGMQAVSQPQDPEWQRVVEMGRQMAPANAFFVSAGTETSPSTPSTDAVLPISAFAAALSTAHADEAKPEATPASAEPPLPALDLHVDLPDDGLAQSTSLNEAAAVAPVAPLPSDEDFAVLDSQLDLSGTTEAYDPPTLVQDTQITEDHAASPLDLDVSGFHMPAPDAASAAPTNANHSHSHSDAEDTSAVPDAGLDLDLSTSDAAITSAPPAAEPEHSFDFDLGSLDLDLGPTDASATDPEPVHNLADDPLATKLDLAQEFNSIGDSEGARSLIEEVLAEASGPLKERAQKMLSEID